MVKPKDNHNPLCLLRVLIWQCNETMISFDYHWIKKSLCKSVIDRQHYTAVLLLLVLRWAEDVMGIQFQAMQQNASLSFLPCVISSVVWLQRDTLKVGSFKVRKREKWREREKTDETRAVPPPPLQRDWSRIEKLKDYVSCFWMEWRGEVGSGEESSLWLAVGPFFL